MKSAGLATILLIVFIPALTYAADTPADDATAAPPPAVTVTISPAYAPMLVSQQLQFSATVAGGTNTTVLWQVDGIIGGNAAVGTISPSGLFTAPSAIPTPAIVNVTAVSQASPTVSATATMTLLTQLATGTTYYVSTSGKDTNSGSFTAPWRTIQHAANSVHAGDTVYVRAGVYNEVVTIPTSGSAAAGYITFSSYPRELATVDGTGLAIPNGQWGLFTLQNQSYVVVQGFEVRNFKTSSTANVPIGIYIFGAGNNVQIVNNHIHNIATTARGCNANAFGLTADGTQAPASIDGLAISGNQVDHLTTGCSESLSVDGNVTNFAITNNVVHDNNNIGIDAIGFEGVSPNPAYDQARNGEIRGNKVYNITSFGNPAYGNQYAADGIYIDGGTQIVVEQNLIHNVDLGLEIASEHQNHYATNISARNNVIYSNNSNGISIGGYASNVGGTQNCTIVNNTLSGNDTKNTGSGEFQIQFHDSSNVFENNILYATTQGLLLNGYTKNASTPATIDYSLYYSTVGSANAQWLYQGTTYTGYSTYLSKTGNDKHSPAFSDPKFVSRTAPANLDLQSGSPAINAGTNLGASIVGTVDFNGNPRVQNGQINLGAYEQ
jgi:hypothetical protein